MDDISSSRFLRYGTSVLALIGATMLRLFLEPVLQDYAPFVTYFGATVLVAWFGGPGPAVLTLFGGALIADLLFIPPKGRLWPTPLGAHGLFLSINLLAIFLIATLQRNRDRAETSERHVQRLLEAGNVGIGLVDQRGAFHYANSALLKLLGYTRKEVQAGQLRWDRITPPEYADVTKEVIRKVEETEAAAIPYEPYEKEYVAKDRRRVPVLIALVPFEKLPDGTGVGAVFVVDLTRIKQAEAALRISEERLRVAAATAAFGAFDLNLQTGEAFWSPELKTILGLRPNDVVDIADDGLPVAIHPDDRDRLKKDIVASLDPTGSGEMETEHRIIGRDGTIRWVINRSKVIFDGQTGHRRPVRRIGAMINITERKGLEDAVVRSEKKYRMLIETLYEGIWLTDQEGNTRFVNSRMAGMLGYSVEEMLGKNLFSFMDDVGKEQAARSMDRRRKGISEEHDLEFLRKDGSRIFTRMAVSPIYDDSGIYTGALAGVLDITERRRVELALQASEGRFRQVVELVPDILYQATLPDFRIKFVSPAIEALLGFAAKEWEDEPELWIRQLHEDDRVRVMDEAKRAIISMDRYMLQYRLWHKDGHSLRWIEDRVRVERNGAQNAVALFGVMNDITDRKRAEEALYRREQEFRALAERSPDIVARFDRSLRCRYVNPVVERVAGKPPDFFIGKTVKEMELPSETETAWEQSLCTVFDTALEQATEFSYVGADKRKGFFDMRLVPEFGPDGQVEGAITVTRDITRQRLAERLVQEKARQLEEANQRLATLSQHDTLTGLANRRYLFTYLNSEWRRELRHDHSIGLIIADIDHFKAYNDHYGHLAGDECLRKVADALRNQIRRPSDLPARYGGEEFVVVLPETDINGARQLAESIRRAVESLRLKHAASPVAPHVTLSLGVADGSPRTNSIEDLISRADHALYLAKASGRNRVCMARD